jgi:molybdate transport system substrate-binding protein
MIMIVRTPWAPLLAGVAALALGSYGTAAAADLDVLSAGAVKSALVVVLPTFETKLGTKITSEFSPVGPILKRLAEGAKPDIIVLSAEAMAEAEAKGFIEPGSVIEIGKVEIGVAVRDGAPLPDISTPEALKAALLAAKSLVYIDPARGTSGRHFAKVLDELGLTEALKARTTLGTGGYVVEPVGRGEIEIGVHQITEILPVAGVKLVGPLPGALQKVTTYVAGVGKGSAKAAEARSLLALIGAPETKAVLDAKGFKIN